MAADLTHFQQCSKSLPVRLPEADNFGEGPAAEDRELFLKFSSILCLWFEIQGRRTDNFSGWVLNTVFKCIFMNDKFCILIRIPLKFVPHVPKGPINNIPALVQIMAWRRSGNKSLPESMFQCMKRPVAHSLNSTWFWIELPENCCEPLKFIMRYISIQFCERPGHGRPFHALMFNQTYVAIWRH